MIQQIRAFFSAPVFEWDLEKTLKSRQLTNILNVLLVGTIIYTPLLPLFAGGIPSRMYLILPLYIVCFGGQLLIRRGCLREASLLLVAGMWLAITSAEVTQGGVKSPAFVGNITVILTVAILDGLTQAVMFTILTLIKGIVLILADQYGFLPAPMEYATSNTVILLTQIFASSLVIALLYMATQNIRLGLGRAHRELAERRQVEKDLQQSEQSYRGLYETAQKQAQELSLESEVRSAMAQELDLPALLRNVVESIANSYGYTFVSLYLVEGEALILQHQVGYKTVIPRIALTEGVCGRVVRTGEAVFLKDVHTDLDFIGAIEGLVSEVCVPLLDEGRVVGVLNVESTNNIELTETDLKLLSGLSEHIGIAIRQARLYSNIQRRNRILSALEESTLVLMRQLDLNEVLQIIVLQAAQIMDTSHGYIYLVQPDEETMQVTTGVGVFSASIGVKLAPDEGLAGKVWTSGQPMKVLNYHDWLGRSHKFDDVTFQAVVGVPLTSRACVIGVLGLAYLETGRGFDDEDIELLNRFAQLASVALENARLYTLLQQELAERRRAEAALVEAETLYRTLVEQTSIVVYRDAPDTSGSSLYISPQIESLLGCSAADWLSDPAYWKQLVHPEDLPRVLADVEQYVTKKGRSSIEYRLRNRDGGWCWVRDETVIVKDEAGNAQFIHGVFLDITERKQAEESLQMFQYSVDQAMDAIFWMDRSAGFTYVNEKACTSLDYTREELLDLHLWDIDPIYPRALWDGNWEGYQKDRQGGDEHLESLHRRKDGSVFPVEVFSKHLWLGDRELHIAVVRDISERKRVEDEREKLIADLENKNAELERFTYTVSHDLKSPLVTIRGFLGFVEQDAQTGDRERLQRDMQRISDATDRMYRLLRELTQLARVGQVMNTPEVIPLADVVKEALETVDGQLQAAGIKVTVQRDLPDVYGDRPRLIEVLQNLIDNAVKYRGDQSDPHIEIGLKRQENGTPIFYVRDNGIGIAPEYHETIFGLFNKLDANSDGTGIGLAIVRRIIGVHGGRIWVESEAGEGTTFYFTLPVK